MSVLSDLGASNAVIATKTLTSTTGVLYVNSFYPSTLGPTGSSQTIAAAGYATMAAYKAALTFPGASAAVRSSITTADQLDYAAWQTASDYIYKTQVTDLSATDNYSTGHIVGSGHYLTNKTIHINHGAIWISGEEPGLASFGTSIGFSGTAGGSSLAPIAVMDCWIYDEFGNPPSGRVGSPSNQPGGIKAIIENIRFVGTNGGNVSTNPSTTKWVSGLRIRKGSFVQVTNCQFNGDLYDGLYFTDAQLFAIIDRNFFYGTHRDSLAILRNRPPGTNNFSTTIWVYNNEFGYQGRYAILMDLSFSIEAMPILRDNSFEGAASNSFYIANPEWFVQGIKANCCYIDCGNLISSGDRCESITLQGYEANFHILGGVHQVMQDGSWPNLYLSTHAASGSYFTPDALATASGGDGSLDTLGYGDITDTRNFRCGTSGAMGDLLEQVQIKNIYNLTNVFMLGATCFSNTGHAYFEGLSFNFWTVPTITGSSARGTEIVATPLSSAHITWVSPDSQVAIYTNCSIGSKTYINNNRYSCSGSGCGTAWVADTVRTPIGTTGTLVIPTSGNYTGYFYQCTSVTGNAKTHATTEPTWPTTIGNTVTDNNVTWTCRGLLYGKDGVSVSEYNEFGTRIRFANSFPSSGELWAVGDKYINRIPAATGYIGWVVTTAGISGAVWKGYGVIQT